jgi:hypothetical protein
MVAETILGIIALCSVLRTLVVTQVSFQFQASRSGVIQVEDDGITSSIRNIISRRDSLRSTVKSDARWLHCIGSDFRPL